MNPRKQALSKIAGNKIAVEDSVKPYNIEAEYGADSFGLKTMEAYLSKPIYKRLRETIKLGVPLDQAVADDVAHAMKIWAMSRGATHYTHWFLPLTGSSAENTIHFWSLPRTAMQSRRSQAKI